MDIKDGGVRVAFQIAGDDCIFSVSKYACEAISRSITDIELGN